MSINGNAGITFDIDEVATTDTGTIDQTYVTPSVINGLTLLSTDIVYSVVGSVGTSSFDFNLNSVNNQSGSGYSTTVTRNNNGDFTSIKMIVIYNSHASNNLIIGSPAANSFFTWNSTSDNITVPPGCGMAFAYSTAATVSTNGLINIKGSSASTTFKIYLLGA